MSNADWLDGQLAENYSERKKKEREELNAQLTEPVVFVPEDAYTKDFGTGYWKALDNKGVISYYRYANGYDPDSRRVYPAEFIDILNKVMAS